MPNALIPELNGRRLTVDVALKNPTQILRQRIGRSHGRDRPVERRFDRIAARHIHRHRGEDDRQHHETTSQPASRAGQEIGRATRAHHPAGRTATTDPQATAFGFLHQDDPDQRCRDQSLKDGEKKEHW